VYSVLQRSSTDEVLADSELGWGIWEQYKDNDPFDDWGGALGNAVVWEATTVLIESFSLSASLLVLEQAGCKFVIVTYCVGTRGVAL
jgi:hypothetical protein